MKLKVGMLVKSKSKLTICPESDGVRDYLNENELGIIINIIDYDFKKHITLLCKSELKNFGLKRITIPHSYSMSESENLSRYFFVVNS